MGLRLEGVPVMQLTRKFTIARDILLYWLLVKVFRYPYRDIWKPAVPGMLARFELECPHSTTTDAHEREGLSMLGRCDGCGCLMVLYLRRFFLDRKDMWAGGERPFLHNIRKSDDDRDPHDHPWDFVTMLLSSGYHEEVWTPSSKGPGSPIGMMRWTHWRPWFSTLRNPATHVHKVQLPENKTVWSFVRVTGRKRKWGFWKAQDDGSYRWMYYRDYLKLHEGPEAAMFASRDDDLQD